MLSLPPRCLAPAFALSLFSVSPLLRAQTPAAKSASVPQVRLQVGIVGVSKIDLDGLGVTFDQAPVESRKGQPMPQAIRLRTVTNSIALQLYQVVTRTRGKMVSVPDRVTPSSVNATFLENAQIPYFLPQTNGGLEMHSVDVPPSKKEMRRLQVPLSITPRVNTDGTVTLIFVPLDGDLNASPKALKVSTAKTVSSGQVVALSGLPFSKEKPMDDQEPLVFVTPSVLNADSPPVIPKASQEIGKPQRPPSPQ